MRMMFELSVLMDDGAEHQVVADQRDIARWEVQPFGWPIIKLEEQASMMFFRFIGFSAMIRQRLTTATWDEFNEHCVEVMPIDDDEEGEGGVPADAGDPGRPALSGTPT